MKIRPKNQTQDDDRQKYMANHCGCVLEESRIGVDAMRNGWPFEFKSLTKNKGVSTARQVHLQKIAKWESQYWLIGKGPYIDGLWDMQVLYIAHPHDLSPFIEKCKDKITRHWEKCKEVLDIARNNGVPTDKLLEIEAIMEVGTRLDDPTIPWKSVVEANCTLLSVLDSKVAQEQIDQFIVDRPIIKYDLESKPSRRLLEEL